MSLKQKLDAGGPVFMARVPFNAPKFVEHLGYIGCDAVMLDCEHTSASVERIEEMTRAARAVGIPAIVRPETLDRAVITRYLDCGVDGIMVPLVEHAAMAREIVRILRYARPNTHAQLLAVAMIESVAAIDALPEMLGVEGIDVFFVARGDLAKSMGLAGEKTHPAVQPQLDRALATLRAAGARIGAAGDIDSVAEVVRKGARLVMVSPDALLQRAFAEYRRRATA